MIYLCTWDELTYEFTVSAHASVDEAWKHDDSLNHSEEHWGNRHTDEDDWRIVHQPDIFVRYWKSSRGHWAVSLVDPHKQIAEEYCKTLVRNLDFDI